MACAFVEGYLDTKTFALISLSEGRSAADYIKTSFDPIQIELNSDLESREIFADFFESMLAWGSSVDFAYLQGDSEMITTAASELESKMDPIGISCENFGWKFKNDWRI